MSDNHEEEGEPWLVSYADLMTLLFGFFVLMYTFEAAKNQDSEGMVKIREEFAKYFGGSYANPLDKITEEIKKGIEEFGGEEIVEVHQSLEGIDLTFKSTVVFDTGKSDLMPEARKIIGILIEVLKDKTELKTVLVEGHTDNVPIINNDIYPSNWELSAARASTVIRMFESNGYDPAILTAIGFGESRPLYPHRDEKGNDIIKNRNFNRRVVVKIMVNPEKM